MEIDKVVRLGDVEVWRGKRANVFCKIQLKDGRLSISGVEGPKRNGDALGSCGQIDMHLRNAQDTIALAPSWTKETLARFFDVWQQWHLNDLTAECEHQRARGESWETHPSAVCPDCGYKLGSAWLRREIPSDVIEFLVGLPDTDVVPAWV